MSGLWLHRRFIWDAAVADLRNRYAGSGLGVLWNVLTPLAMLSLYALIFGGLFASRSAGGGVSGASFVLYLTSGFLPWIAFSDGIMRGAQALVLRAAYLKRTPIPEQVFVAEAGISAGLSMLIAVVLLIGLALVMGAAPVWTWLLLPLVSVLWQAFGFGVSLTLSVLNVFFRDITQVLGVLMQIWMWSLPIVYFDDLLPQFYRNIVQWNPCYPFLQAIRASYLGGSVPGPSVWLTMVGWIAVTSLVGLTCVRRLRVDIRDAL